jgi:hypothetical protein
MAHCHGFEGKLKEIWNIRKRNQLDQNVSFDTANEISKYKNEKYST